jgi:hypothetical protein
MLGHFAAERVETGRAISKVFGVMSFANAGLGVSPGNGLAELRLLYTASFTTSYAYHWSIWFGTFSIADNRQPG